MYDCDKTVKENPAKEKLQALANSKIGILVTGPPNLFIYKVSKSYLDEIPTSTLQRITDVDENDFTVMDVNTKDDSLILGSEKMFPINPSIEFADL